MAVTDKMIARINELYKKSKTVGLTEEEAMEQATLRKEYIQSFHNNLRGTLDTMKIQHPDGTIEEVKNRRKKED